MAIIYLLPSVDLGPYLNVTHHTMEIVGANTFHGAIDDPVNAPDDDVSYLGVTNNRDAYKFGCYLPNDFSAKSIEYVRFWLRGARITNDSQSKVKLIYENDAILIGISSVYPNYTTVGSAIFYNNPMTNQPWIENDLNPIIFIIELRTISGGGIKYPSRATQAYVEVSYDPLELNGNGAFLLASLNQ